MIDIWIVGHGSRGGFNISKGRYGSDETMRSSEIRDLATIAGKSELPIRMVWATLCHGETLNSAWRAGAKVVASSKKIVAGSGRISKRTQPSWDHETGPSASRDWTIDADETWG